jgi:hypothetical protein
MNNSYYDKSQSPYLDISIQIYQTDGVTECCFQMKSITYSQPFNVPEQITLQEDNGL